MLAKRKKYIQSGFTLLEVLVAILLLAFMMLSVYSMVQNSTDSKDRILAEDQEILALEFALYRIELDINQVYTPLFHSGMQRIDSSLYEDKSIPQNTQDEQKNLFEPSEKFPLMTARGHLVPAVDSESKDSLTLFTSANRRKIEDSKQSRYAWIRYSLRSTKQDEYQEEPRSESELVRQIVAENIYSKEHEWEKVRSQVLLKNIKDLKFSFWNEDLKKFIDNPRQLNEKKNSIRMIKVELTWVNQSGNEDEFSRTFRIGWPYFDPQSDIDAIKNSSKNKKNDSNDSDEEDGQGNTK